MNNMVILNHYRLFICMDIGYFNSYHDVNILWHFNIYKTLASTWRWIFWVPIWRFRLYGWIYFFMHKIKCWELTPYFNHFVMWTYNKMLEGFNMQVKWGIRGLKRKWRCFMKRFDSTKSKYSYLLQATSLLTNFMQYRKRVDFMYEVISDQNVDTTHGWLG